MTMKVVNIVKEFNEFLKNYNALFEGSKSLHKLSLLKKLKLAYYVYFKYPNLQKKLTKALFSTVVEASGKPFEFISLLSDYLVILVSMKNNIDDINKLIEKKFSLHNNKFYPPIIIKSLQTTDDRLEKCSFVICYKSRLEKFYKNNVIYSEVDIDFLNATCNIETNVHESENITDYTKSQIIYHKNYNILSNGKFNNPNYLLDKALEEEELKEFPYHVVAISTPFIDLVFSICLVDFVVTRGIVN